MKALVLKAQRDTTFRVNEALALADDVLSRPPALAHIERPVPLPNLVARFALPLELCKPMNRIARAGTQQAGWALKKMKHDTFLRMMAQCGRRGSPLPGRPQVLALRLSSSEPDKYADWQKNPVDRLRANPKMGLAYIVDDSPRCIDLQAWWEPAKAGHGAVIIEVRTGGET